MHFSQIRSSVSSSLERGLAPEAELLRIHLQGFIDVPILRERLDGVFSRLQQDPPVVVLCDLRTVAGYGPGTPTLAREWLQAAQRTNVHRVAMLVGSSVIRTAVKVLAAETHVPLRCFLGEREALRWLEGPWVGDAAAKAQRPLTADDLIHESLRDNLRPEGPLHEPCTSL